MSLVTIAAVHAGLKAWWDQTSKLTAAVPGHLWEGRPQEQAALPYAVAELAARDVIWDSGIALQPFDLSITVYSDAGRTDAGVVEAALRSEIKHEHRSRLHVVGATKTVQLLSQGWQSRTETDTKSGQNVLATVGRWDLILESVP